LFTLPLLPPHHSTTPLHHTTTTPHPHYTMPPMHHNSNPFQQQTATTLNQFLQPSHLEPSEGSNEPFKFFFPLVFIFIYSCFPSLLAIKPHRCHRRWILETELQ
jgi:hypothetical protein